MLSKIIEWSLRNQFLVVVALIFAILGGVWAVSEIRLDAIPDLSDVQVIIFTEYPGQAPAGRRGPGHLPDHHQDAVGALRQGGARLLLLRLLVRLRHLRGRHRPLLGAHPGAGVPVRPPGPAARGGHAAARARRHRRRLGLHVRPATPTAATWPSCARIQDWYLRYELTAVEGVSEVASVGGFVQQYQVKVDPVKLRAYDIPLARVREAIQRLATPTSAAALMEMAETEFMVRGSGLHQGRSADLEQIPLGVGAGGTPILLKDVANVTIGPGDAPRHRRVERRGRDRGRHRRGALRRQHPGGDPAGQGEAGRSSRHGLPDDVQHRGRLRPHRADRASPSRTLTRTLIEESIVVALVCVVFLFHFRRAFVAILVHPGGHPALLHRHVAPGPRRQHHVPGRHRHRHRRDGGRRHRDGRERPQALRGVDGQAQPLRDHPALGPGGRPDPVLLPAGHHRLVHAGVHPPGAGGAAVQAAGLHQDLRHGRVGGAGHHDHPGAHVLVRPRRIRSEETPSGFPAAALALHAGAERVSCACAGWWSLLAVVLVASIAIPAGPHRLGVHAARCGRATCSTCPPPSPASPSPRPSEILQQTDTHHRPFPEVESVFGKIGRAETATDPAPADHDRDHHPAQAADRVAATGMTTGEARRRSSTQAVRFPRPDQRLDHAHQDPHRHALHRHQDAGGHQGRRSGPARSSSASARRSRPWCGRCPARLSAYAERVMGGNYLDFDIDREAARPLRAHRGRRPGRDPVGHRRHERHLDGRGAGALPDQRALPAGASRQPGGRWPRCWFTTPTGAQVPLGQVADLGSARARRRIKTENAQAQRVDLRGSRRPRTWAARSSAPGRWSSERGRAVPEGYTVFWTGQYEYMERAEQRLLVIVPITLLPGRADPLPQHAIWTKTAIVLLAVPFSVSAPCG